MKRIIPFILSALMIGMISCGPEEVIFDPSSDVFIVTKTITNADQTDTVYGLALHVFANKAIQSAVAGPDDGSNTTYELTAFGGYPYDFFYQTPDADFSSTVPYIGDYSFDVIAQSNESSIMGDKLLDDFIYPTDSLGASFDSSTGATKLGWHKIEDADYIVIKLFNTDEDMLFSSSAMQGSKTYYSFGASTSGWANGESPQTGTDYLIELDAYMYEPGQTGVNIQAKSVSLKSITWGE